MKNKKEKKGKPAKKAPTPAVKPVAKELSDQDLESVTGGIGVTKGTDIASPRDIATG
jgi:bacteriocin-like protein